MKKSSVKLSVIVLAAVIGSIFFNKYVLKEKLIFYPKSFINSASYLFMKAEKFGSFAEKIKYFNRLASENDKLRQDQKTVLGVKARIDDIESENDFLRRAIHLSEKADYSIIYAGIFNLNFVPGGYNVLLNKGTRDGISEGDIVITAEGILVGKIEKVMQNFSRVIFISDPEFKITAKIMNLDTTGIARGALNEGMYLDFIVQGDEIEKGDTLISTGDDLFPPALIVGFVDQIETNVAQIYKKVRIRPAIKDVRLGKVLVIKVK